MIRYKILKHEIGATSWVEFYATGAATGAAIGAITGATEVLFFAYCDTSIHYEVGKSKNLHQSKFKCIQLIKIFNL